VARRRPDMGHQLRHDFSTPLAFRFTTSRQSGAGADPRLLLSWYSGDYCTDPDFAELEPELRANPSIG
jgi:hypothetical protein